MTLQVRGTGRGIEAVSQEGVSGAHLQTGFSRAGVARAVIRPARRKRDAAGEQQCGPICVPQPKFGVDHDTDGRTVYRLGTGRPLVNRHKWRTAVRQHDMGANSPCRAIDFRPEPVIQRVSGRHIRRGRKSAPHICARVSDQDYRPGPAATGQIGYVVVRFGMEPSTDKKSGGAQNIVEVVDHRGDFAALLLLTQTLLSAIADGSILAEIEIDWSLDIQTLASPDFL